MSHQAGMGLVTAMAWLDRQGHEHRLAVAVSPLVLAGPVSAVMAGRGGTVGAALALALGVTSLVAVAVRRRRPITAITLAAAVYLVIAAPETAGAGQNVVASMSSVAIGSLVVGYGVLVDGSPRVRRVAAATAVAVVLVQLAVLWWRWGIDLFAAALLLLSLLLALTLTEWTRTRRAQLENARQRAVLAERLQKLAAESAVADERLRLAAELHDGVAGRLGALAMHVTAMRQAGRPRVGPAAVDRPHGTADSQLRGLDIVSDELSAALGELRGMLDLLRVREGEHRVPGLERLDEPVRWAREQGADLTVTVRGAVPAVAAGHPDVSHAAFRILQEALTNVVRHARPPVARVHVTAADSGITIDVADDGSSSRAHEAPDPPPRSGHGLDTMAERAARLGGTFRAGPRAGGGWALHAHLPTEPTLTPATELSAEATVPLRGGGSGGPAGD